MRKRDDAKHDAIVEAAIHLINEHGFAAVSIAKIAREAGVSPATIYIYFENKQDLLNKLYLMVKQELSLAVRITHNPAKSWEEDFKRAYRFLAGYVRDHGARFRFMEQCDSNPMLTDATRETGVRFFEDTMTFFELGAKEGVFKPLNHALLTAVVFAPLMQAMQSTKRTEPLDETTVNLLADCAWDAISAKGE